MQAIQDYYIAPGAIIRGDVVLSPASTSGSARSFGATLPALSLGPRVNIQDGSIVHTDHEMPQTIDEGVVVGHGAVLHARTLAATR